MCVGGAELQESEHLHVMAEEKEQQVLVCLAQGWETTLVGLENRDGQEQGLDWLSQPPVDHLLGWQVLRHF